MKATVIIPTYNRPGRLAALLESLADQTLPAELFDVVVVDDGSTESYAEIVERPWPFCLRYNRQRNAGATAARNMGAGTSSSLILVFIDDDIRLYSPTLESLVKEMEKREHVIILGMLVDPDPHHEKYHEYKDGFHTEDRLTGDVHFTHCMTGLLAVRRDDFILLGGFQDPTGGWPNWDDVDFGYRAFLKGFKMIRLQEARAEHWDYASVNLDAACQRWERASESAARLFERYPELFPEIPMFHDKAPIDWSKDLPSTVIRKSARIVISSRPVVSALEVTARFTESLYPKSSILRPLSRWIAGAYMFRGYRRGLKELKDSPPIIPAAKIS